MIIKDFLPRSWLAARPKICIEGAVLLGATSQSYVFRGIGLCKLGSRYWVYHVWVGLSERAFRAGHDVKMEDSEENKQWW